MGVYFLGLFLVENLVELTEWKKIRKKVSHINPSLSGLIDELDPSNEYPLIKLNNRFGDLLVTNGKFSIDLGDLKNLVNYSQIPLSLVMDKYLEVFVKNDERIIPLNIVKEGGLLGLFETIDSLFSEHSNPPWCVTSGARSIFLLPRVTDQSRYRKLNLTYGLPPSHQVRNLKDQWFFLKSLARHPNFRQKWNSETLIFTNPWFNKNKNDSKEWRNFYDYVFGQAWHIANFALLKFNVELEWESFANALFDRRLKFDQYVSDNIKHLMMLSAAKLPGFTPADHSQKAAPTNEFQRIYIEEYQLKDYAPILMHTAPLDTIFKNPVYYSLSYPTLLEGAPGTSNNKTIMMDLLDIMTKIKTIQERVKEESFIKNIHFSYFHSEKNARAYVESSRNLSTYDNRFSKYNKVFSDRIFPDMSPFWWGCIGIKREI